MARLFISYARDDDDMVADLVAALVAKGFQVRWDHDIPTGFDWDSFIRTEIALASLVIVFWTRSSARSHYVRDEAGLARDTDKLLPVMLEEMPVAELPLGFGRLQTLSAFDLVETEDWPALAARIADAARKMLPAQPEADARTRHITEIEAMLAEPVDGEVVRGPMERAILARLVVDRTPLRIFVVNGVRHEGVATAVDHHTLLLARDGSSQILYLHTVAVIQPLLPVKYP